MVKVTKAAVDLRLCKIQAKKTQLSIRAGIDYQRLVHGLCGLYKLRPDELEKIERALSAMEADFKSRT